MTTAGHQIAIDARAVSGPMCGMARYTLNLLHGLARAPAASPLILLTCDPSALPADVRSSAAFRLLRLAGRPGPRDQWGLARRLESEGVGLLYSLDAWAPMTGAFRRAITIYDLIPLLCRRHLRRSWKARLAFLWKAWLRAQCRRADAVVTVSRSSAADIRVHLGVPAEKLHVIYGSVRVADERTEGSPAKAGKPAGGASDGPYALYVGRCDPYKNLRRLVEAFALVRRGHPDLRLIVAGPRDPRYPEAEAAARRLGLNGAARFTGAVSDAELRELYRGASLLAMPSLREGFGLPPLEAMSFGVPVVASNAASLPEVCGNAALRADPFDPAALAAAMERVLSDATLAERLRRRGLRQAARFTPAAQAARTLALLERLLKEPAP
jgi:glycosyltransferase involved in cell wall biosynthesis